MVPSTGAEIIDGSILNSLRVTLAAPAPPTAATCFASLLLLFADAATPIAPNASSTARSAKIHAPSPKTSRSLFRSRATVPPVVVGVDRPMVGDPGARVPGPKVPVARAGRPYLP